MKRKNEAGKTRDEQIRDARKKFESEKLSHRVTLLENHDSLIPCPECNGIGTTFQYCVYMDGTIEPFGCQLCYGTGKIIDRRKSPRNQTNKKKAK